MRYSNGDAVYQVKASITLFLSNTLSLVYSDLTPLLTKNSTVRIAYLLSLTPVRPRLHLTPIGHDVLLLGWYVPVRYTAYHTIRVYGLTLDRHSARTGGHIDRLALGIWELKEGGRGVWG